MISNILNKKNAITYDFISFGTSSKEIAMPVTSSITICFPSSPKISSPLVADHMLIKNKPMLTGNNIQKKEGIKNQIIPNVIKLPKVPGAKGKYPAKKKVEISLAKNLLFNIIFFFCRGMQKQSFCAP